MTDHFSDLLTANESYAARFTGRGLPGRAALRGPVTVPATLPERGMARHHPSGCRASIVPVGLTRLPDPRMTRAPDASRAGTRSAGSTRRRGRDRGGPDDHPSTSRWNRAPRRAYGSPRASAKSATASPSVRAAVMSKK